MNSLFLVEYQQERSNTGHWYLKQVWSGTFYAENNRIIQSRNIMGADMQNDNPLGKKERSRRKTLELIAFGATAVTLVLVGGAGSLGGTGISGTDGTTGSNGSVTITFS